MRFTTAANDVINLPVTPEFLVGEIEFELPAPKRNTHRVTAAQLNHLRLRWASFESYLNHCERLKTAYIKPASPAKMFISID